MISPLPPKKVWVCEVQVVYGKSSADVKRMVGFMRLKLLNDN